MSDLDISRDVLFVGLGASPVAYYRCMLPAMALGADWIGISGEPPKLHWHTGLAKDEHGVPQSGMPDLFDYRIIVIQQPASEAWEKVIKGLQAKGVKVIFETDDYLHGVRRQEDHQAKEFYNRKYLRASQACMAAADALIASTEYIRSNYASFNPNAYLCRNGIDLGRYNLSPAPRDTINIGWAGATGHIKTVIPWLQQVAQIMFMREDVNFISIGENFAAGMRQPHGPFAKERALPIPWSAVETYPAAMRMFDIALAPGGKGGWWRGKSDLRWLEAGALGIPAVVTPSVYPEAVEGETAMLARSPAEVLSKLYGLVNNADLREEIGAKVKEHVRTKRSMQVMCEQWAAVFEDVAD
jgi:glycosyltransferase involved in cell wall biosynthesis